MEKIFLFNYFIMGTMGKKLISKINLAIIPCELKFDIFYTVYIYYKDVFRKISSGKYNNKQQKKILKIKEYL